MLLFLILAATLILVGKVVYSEYYKLCGRCYKPIVPNTISQITKDYVNLKIVYSKNNGSLPPSYYREDVYTITTDRTEIITGEYTIRDYDKVTEKNPLVISREQFTKLIAAAEKINPESNDSINLGCTGGSAKSIKISQNDKVLLDTSAYNCADKSTNESLEKFSAEFEKILPRNK